ncbi:MAG: DUF4163 domain-containing protein, partial [Chitinophagaceae bacterium]|nr:DUF4163 domain-containing protein [Chitinophagaceae bacterium]
MSKYAFVLLILFGVLAGCGNEEQPAGDEPKAAELIAEEGFEADDDIVQGMYKRYIGTIADMPVVVNLTDLDARLNGHYYYEKIGLPINIYSYHRDEDAENEFVFGEYPPEHKDPQDKWYVTVQGDSIVGVWVNGDSTKSFPISLKEDYPEGIMRFGIVSVEESFPYKEGASDPAAEVSYTVILPMGRSAGAQYVKAVISQTVGCDTNAKNMQDCIQQKIESYGKMYRQTMSDMGEDMDNSPMNNWDESIGITIVYNANDIVVLDRGHYEYSGGAHGNHSDDYVNIDVRHQKVMKLDDMMTVDSARLVQLITPQLRKRF